MIALITGSGMYDLPGLTGRDTVAVDHPYGPPVPVTVGTWNGHDVCVVPRHGSDHSVAPHAIDYRGIVGSLKAVGARAVLATAAVGAIEPSWPPGTLAVLTDFIDFTSGRNDTFFDGSTPPMAGISGDDGSGIGVVHTDMSAPYDPVLRAALVAAAGRLAIPVEPSAVYCCANGPRFETRAEIAMMSRLGGQVVGMTGYPEVALAAEAGLPYASIGLVANPAAGIGATIAVEDVLAQLARMAERVALILEATIDNLAGSYP